MKDVIIIGTGGHAKVVADIIELRGDHLKGFLTNDQTITTFLGKPVLGLDTDIEKFPDAYFIIAIGDASVRERIAASMPEAKWYTAIHPSAVISEIDTQIGAGTMVSAGAVINACATIGEHCIINTHATVEHDNKIEAFAHISVGAMLAGAVTVGKRAWVGIGTSVLGGITICDDAMIGAGAVVVKNIEKPGTYIGVPAKEQK